ncbi:MFS transporter [Streptomyces winkii]|uniref:MFS transporter n=1 Tax=Streptomyces winkii TaxID=3051178 RepID=UPI0028D128B3|nr:MFS transporter [Streptomyces sp. DSM 40971]
MSEAGRRPRGGVPPAVIPLLTATTTTTMANTVVNVPMAEILRGLDAPLSAGVLVATAFTVVFATLMPVSGWLGERFGYRRVFCAAMLGMAVGSAGAAFAGSLPVLVAFRLVQGVSAAPVLPAVMVLVVRAMGSERRGRALGLWAAANGAGQTLGPVTGGLLAEWAGWRAVFWPIVPLSLLAVLAGVRLLPRERGGAARLEWRGAALLTCGAGLLLGALSSIPALGAGSPVVWVAAAAGLGTLAAFVRVEIRRRDAFLPPRDLLDGRYLRSAFAVAVQMFALGATLLAAPLYLVRMCGLSTGSAGLMVLALPLAMALLAPVAGIGSERLGGRPVMLGGLLALMAGQLGLAVAVGAGRGPGAVLGALLVVGCGVACVQTPAATGASRSRGGASGAGLGLFNLVRFGGSAMGSACVALLGVRQGDLVELFSVCAAVVAVAAVGACAGATSPGRTVRNAAGDTRQATLSQ